MATEHNWFRTNLAERLSNKHKVFSTNIEQANEYIKFKPISFHEAVEEVTKKISKRYSNIYIPLSGGMDSEFVFNCFRKNNTKFTPIIVDTPINKKESSFAFVKCEETNMNPIVIKMTEKELFDIYYNEIFKKLYSKGYNSVACYVAAKYAHDQNGIAVIAEHGYDGCNEWDFYNDVLIDLETSLYFFMYTPRIYHAMKNEYKGGNHQLFKQQLYGIPLRKKMKYEFSEQYQLILDNIVMTINRTMT